jgi:hypothetical protein
MNRAVQWLRRVYPPWWAVMFALLFYAVLELIYWTTRGFGVPIDDLTECLRVRDGIMLIATGGYALFRVGMFHPLFRPGYRRWLEQTPWTVEKPLPLGPLYIVAQDALMLVMIRLLLHDSQLDETALPQVFLLSYLFAAACALWGTDERSVAYVVVFAYGLAILTNWWSPLTGLACLIGCYFAAAVGIRRSLRRFPWNTSVQRWRKIWRNANAGNATFKQRQENCREIEPHPASLGWPYNQLSAYAEPPSTSRADRVAISLLAGWLLFAVAACPDFEPEARIGGTMFVFGYGMFGCISSRLFLYCQNHWPPISLWGRFWTGRWIIPGYDKVFVAPLLAVVVGWGGVALAWICTDGNQPWFAPICGVAWALTLMITTVMGPSYQVWRLTARARIGQPPFMSGKLLEKI